jgi:uncharacterized protein
MQGFSMTVIGRLFEQLHGLRTRLHEIETSRERAKRQLAIKTTGINKKKEELEQTRNDLKQARMAVDQKNLQLKTNESKIADWKNKQNQASSNREYDIIKNQILADTMANSVLEDEIIESLEKVDRAQIAIKEKEQEVAAAESEFKKVESDLTAKLPGLEAEAAKLRIEVEETEKHLPPEIEVIYRRLVQAHGPDALSAVATRSCSNCYLELTQQMLVELRAGKPLMCKSCARYLYVPSTVPS